MGENNGGPGKRLCAHADLNGDGAHWLEPGESCHLLAPRPRPAFPPKPADPADIGDWEALAAQIQGEWFYDELDRAEARAEIERQEMGMATRITDTEMASDVTSHSAHYVTQPEAGWSVTFLPGRLFDRNQAITAMTIAEAYAGGYGPESKWWPHIEAWADELGMSVEAVWAELNAASREPAMFADRRADINEELFEMGAAYGDLRVEQGEDQDDEPEHYAQPPRIGDPRVFCHCGAVFEDKTEFDAHLDETSAA